MEHKRFPEPVEALLLILAALFGLLGLVILIGAVFGFDMSTPAFDQNMRYLFVFGGAVFLIVPYGYAKAKNYDTQTLFRFNKVPMPVVYLSLVVSLALTVVGDELDRLVNMVFPIPEWMLEQVQPLQAQGIGDWVLVILGAVVVAGIAEEALFRGFFQVTLEQKGDATRAVLLSSLGWTLIHMNPYWAIQIFIMGVFIGFLAWRTNSIIPAIIVHGTNNLIALFFLNFHLDRWMSWYLWNDHVSPPVLVVAVGALYWALRHINQFYQPSD
ncbi:MAG: CPBP family intramembrane metalloprotease [Caldithrix sp.]|nr:CPBP family intramembrane metalloprotease [Caldithrix sp.]